MDHVYQILCQSDHDLFEKSPIMTSWRQSRKCYDNESRYIHIIIVLHKQQLVKSYTHGPVYAPTGVRPGLLLPVQGTQL